MPDLPLGTFWFLVLVVAAVILATWVLHLRNPREPRTEFDGEVNILDVLFAPITLLLVIVIPGAFALWITLFLLILR
ncbi:MAG: hypothetical protein AABM30_10770 [Actinomycetota bacterium]